MGVYVGTNSIVAALAAAQRRVIERLRVAGANRPEGAIGLEPQEQMEKRGLARLERAGIVRRERDGRLWVDEVKAAAQGQRKRRLMLLLALLAVAIGALVVMGIFRRDDAWAESGDAPPAAGVPQSTP